MMLKIGDLSRKLKREFIRRIASNINEPFYSIIINIYNYYIKWTTKKEMYSYGKENPNEIIYIIVINDAVSGYASFYDMVLGHLIYSLKNGYIPVIDFSNKNNTAIYDMNLRGNPWTYFFEQPLVNGKRYTLSEAYNSKNVIIANKNLITMYKRIKSREIAKRRRVADLIPYTDEMKKKLAEREKDILSIIESSESIGVYYRGTDYKKYENWAPAGHAKPPTIEIFIEKLIEYSINVSCRTIFFMSDEQEAVDYIRSKMGTDYKVMYIDHPRYCKFKGGKAVSSTTPFNISRYENNFYYLMDIDLLSKCTFLFGIKNAGMQMAINLNGNKYKDVHILRTEYY